MKRVGIIHSVKVVCNSFEPQLKKELPELQAYNLLDDYLSKELETTKGMTDAISARFVSDVKGFETLGVDAVVCTCSSISRIVPDVRKLFSIPLLSIDELMVHEAASISGKALIAATSFSAIEPLENSLRKCAKENARDLSIESLFIPEAGKIMHDNGNMADHDAIICKRVQEKDLSGFDRIVLAQASLAQLKDVLERQTGLPVFTNVDYCIRNIKEIVYNEH